MHGTQLPGAVIAVDTLPWREFQDGPWQTEIDVRDFIQRNYEPYDGDGAFLVSATTRTKDIRSRVSALLAHERRYGVSVSDVPSAITAHEPGYIDRSREIIVGLQTEVPLKRAIASNGTVDTHISKSIFDAYTADVRRCRSSHILSGLPDSYRRGRIAGDYRRVALYGVEHLVERKRQEKHNLDAADSSEQIIRDRAELTEQIRALADLVQMAASYGFDISVPARNAREAVQWVYFAYLAGVKEQDGAAASLGRLSTFLDIYFARDLASGELTEYEAQEIIDDFMIKLRMVGFVRTGEYDAVFAGDPSWPTESIAGMGEDGRTLVTKTSFRFLQTLYNLEPAASPNLTVWYSPHLPVAFRRFAAKVALETSVLHFENDEILRLVWGDDGALVCCVSPTKPGAQMQLFGATANLAKCLLYAINGGRDEITGEQIGPPCAPVSGECLDFDDVARKFETMMEWLAGVYADAMNVIHFMHDRYAYERLEMALHDHAPVRTMGFGLAGLSVVADSLSAIKFAKTRVVRDDTGLVIDYEVEGAYPAFGNNDNRVDELASWAVSTFMNKLRKRPTYRNARPTLSILTMASNRLYATATGNTPDGRRGGESFAPGANPMHLRDNHGMLAAAASVAKIPYRDVADVVSLTASLVPSDLGHVDSERITHLTELLDALFAGTRYHVNVNVLSRATLVDARDYPAKYPNLTVRVSGCAVDFVSLSREQQMEVLNRTSDGTPRHA
jgi:formate C-acetyltransferase